MKSLFSNQSIDNYLNEYFGFCPLDLHSRYLVENNLVGMRDL